jgi:hypothetical protein
MGVFDVGLNSCKEFKARIEGFKWMYSFLMVFQNRSIQALSVARPFPSMGILFHYHPNTVS